MNQNTRCVSAAKRPSFLSSVFNAKISSAIALAFVLFATASGSGFSGSALKAKALTMDELQAASSPQVLGITTYPTVTITSATNLSLLVTVTPLSYDSTANQWTYQIYWKRTRNAQGSLYVTLKSDKTQVLLTVDPASQTGTQIVTLAPSTAYRVEFYTQPAQGGNLLLRKFFTTLSSSAVSGSGGSPSIPPSTYTCTNDPLANVSDTDIVQIAGTNWYFSRQSPTYTTAGHGWTLPADEKKLEAQTNLPCEHYGYLYYKGTDGKYYFNSSGGYLSWFFDGLPLNRTDAMTMPIPGEWASSRWDLAQATPTPVSLKSYNPSTYEYEDIRPLTPSGAVNMTQDELAFLNAIQQKVSKVSYQSLIPAGVQLPANLTLVPSQMLVNFSGRQGYDMRPNGTVSMGSLALYTSQSPADYNANVGVYFIPEVTYNEYTFFYGPPLSAHKNPGTVVCPNSTGTIDAPNYDYFAPVSASTVVSQAFSPLLKNTEVSWVIGTGKYAGLCINSGNASYPLALNAAGAALYQSEGGNLNAPVAVDLTQAPLSTFLAANPVGKPVDDTIICTVPSTSAAPSPDIGTNPNANISSCNFSLATNPAVNPTPTVTFAAKTTNGYSYSDNLSVQAGDATGKGGDQITYSWSGGADSDYSFALASITDINGKTVTKDGCGNTPNNTWTPWNGNTTGYTVGGQPFTYSGASGYAGPYPILACQGGYIYALTYTTGGTTVTLKLAVYGGNSPSSANPTGHCEGNGGGQTTSSGAPNIVLQTNNYAGTTKDLYESFNPYYSGFIGSLSQASNPSLNKCTYGPGTVSGFMNWFHVVQTTNGWQGQYPYAATQEGGNEALRIVNFMATQAGSAPATLELDHFVGEAAGQDATAFIRRSDGVLFPAGIILDNYYNKGSGIQTCYSDQYVGMIMKIKVPNCMISVANSGLTYSGQVVAQQSFDAYAAPAGTVVPASQATPIASLQASTAGANGPWYSTLAVSPGTNIWYKWTSTGGTSYYFDYDGFLNSKGLPVFQDGCNLPAVKYGLDITDPSVIAMLPFEMGTLYSPSLNQNNWSPVPSGGNSSNGVSGPFAIQPCQAGYTYRLNYAATNKYGSGQSDLVIGVASH